MWDFICNCILKNEDSILFDNNNKLSYKEFLNKIKNRGDELKELMSPKSKCAVLCNNGLNTAICILACLYADLVPIPMSKNYGENHCKNIIDLTNPDIIIYDNNVEIINQTPKTEEILNDVAIIMCTSGTTGAPKGAMITEQGLIKNVENIAAYFDIKKDDTILIARPLYHCAVLTGELLVSLYKGLNIGFFDEVYNPVSVLNFMNENEITVFCGTPTLFNHLSMCLKRVEFKTNLKTIAISGECLSKKAATNIRSAFPNVEIYNVYGLTEAAPRVSFLYPKYFDEYPESVGIPLNDTFLKTDDTGRIFLKSPSIMKGYYHNEASTNRVLIDGWLDTGDIGYIDSNGFLYIVSRADDMIIKAGMNIYPKEIENQIANITQIQECIVYGVKTDAGQAIAADFVLNTEITKKELMNLLATVLPMYQMPTEINIVDSLKRNASGKIVRPRS